MYPTISDDAYKRIQVQFVSYKYQHPQASATEMLIGLHRLYEREMYGVSARDLVRGYQVRYQRDPDDPNKVYKLKSKVRGLFLSSLNGVGDPNSFPSAVYERDEWKIEDGKHMTEKMFYHDLQAQREINLAVEYTSRDMGDGESLLESGIDTGYGSTTGVITPVFQDLMLRLAAEKTMWKNFVSLIPMPDMTFYFPMRNSIVSDNTTAVAFDSVATGEGLAGLDIAIKYTKWEVNGWKFLRHFEITDEVRLMLGKFINVQADMVADLAQAHALLWDYSIAYGMKSMLVTGLWRRWDETATASFKDSDTEIPFGKASVLLGNAKLSYLYQDMTTGAGKIYEPSATTGEEFVYDDSVARAGSAATDELLEGISALGTLLENKGSELQFVALPSSKAELLFNDPRIANQTINTGITEFSSENGYLGRVNIIGTSTQVDVWKYNTDVHPASYEDDDPVTTKTLFPVWGGSYGKFWALGTYTPYYMRIDDGFEVIDGAGVGAGGVLRSNETSVFTSGSRGSSWPLDYHHLGCLWLADEVHGA